MESTHFVNEDTAYTCTFEDMRNAERERERERKHSELFRKTLCVCLYYSLQYTIDIQYIVD